MKCQCLARRCDSSGSQNSVMGTLKELSSSALPPKCHLFVVCVNSAKVSVDAFHIKDRPKSKHQSFKNFGKGWE